MDIGAGANKKWNSSWCYNFLPVPFGTLGPLCFWLSFIRDWEYMEEPYCSTKYFTADNKRGGQDFKQVDHLYRSITVPWRHLERWHKRRAPTRHIRATPVARVSSSTTCGTGPPTDLQDWSALKGIRSKCRIHNWVLLTPMPLASTAHIMCNKKRNEPYPSKQHLS